MPNHLRLLIFIALILCQNCFPDQCRGSEGSCINSQCIACSESGGDKSPGEISLMSKYSEPVFIDPNSEEKKCVPCSCGDDKRDIGEECDDGNNTSRDGCNVICKIERCGDKIINLPDEECDDGNTINSDNCTNDCKKPVCGDNIIWNQFEECDDGNKLETDSCTNNCKIARCGDGIVTPAEECDDANNIDTDECTNSCKKARCGDLIVSAGEACDDGNDSNLDICNNSCQISRCGDGYVNVFGEVCDAGQSNGKLGSNCNQLCLPTDACQRSEGDPNYSDPDCCKDVPMPVAEGLIAAGGGGNVCVKSPLMKEYFDKVTYLWSNSKEIYFNYWKVDTDGKTYLHPNYINDPLTIRAIEQFGEARINDVLLYPHIAGENMGTWINFIMQEGFLNIYQTEAQRYCWTCALVRWHGCFVPETLITMADGSQKVIEQIRAGDLVLNPITGLAQAVKTIIESNEKEAIVEINIGGKTVKVTQGHPMFDGDKFIKANTVQVGTKLKMSDGVLASVESVRNLELDPNQRVINITLESENTDINNHMLIAEGIVTGDLLTQQLLAKSN